MSRTVEKVGRLYCITLPGTGTPSVSLDVRIPRILLLEAVADSLIKTDPGEILVDRIHETRPTNGFTIEA